MRLMSMKEKDFSDLVHFLNTGTALDGSIVTDQWVEAQLKACVQEITALSTQLDDLYEIMNDSTSLELAAKKLCRAWKKKADLEPHLKQLQEALASAKSQKAPDSTVSLSADS
jgi:hypothetical protein